MKVKDLLNYGENLGYLDYSRIILSSIYGIGKLDVLTIKENEVDESIYQEFISKLEDVINGRPIQYVIGNVDFCDINLIVNENVLIPRFETEELVDNTYRIIKKYFRDDVKILDLCCGSGAIGLSLKNRLRNSDVILSDISDGALDVAKDNARRLSLDVKVVKSDLLNDIDCKFDIIISNPPYIMLDEEIEDIVRNNEPHLALYAGVDGLDCYKKILSDISKNLNENYLIAFEIGYSQKDAIFKLVRDNLKDAYVTCLKDLSGNDRMIFISNNKDVIDL